MTTFFSFDEINIICPKFCKFGDEFFYFDKISKMRILEPKNAFWKGAKKHEVKKVVGSKNVFYKSCRKFYILGGDFFSF